MKQIEHENNDSNDRIIQSIQQIRDKHATPLVDTKAGALSDGCLYTPDTSLLGGEGNSVANRIRTELLAHGKLVNEIPINKPLKIEKGIE